MCSGCCLGLLACAAMDNMKLAAACACHCCCLDLCLIACLMLICLIPWYALQVDLSFQAVSSPSSSAEAHREWPCSSTSSSTRQAVQRSKAAVQQRCFMAGASFRRAMSEFRGWSIAKSASLALPCIFQCCSVAAACHKHRMLIAQQGAKQQGRLRNAAHEQAANQCLPII